MDYNMDYTIKLKGQLCMSKNLTDHQILSIHKYSFWSITSTSIIPITGERFNTFPLDQLKSILQYLDQEEIYANGIIKYIDFDNGDDLFIIVTNNKIKVINLNDLTNEGFQEI